MELEIDEKSKTTVYYDGLCYLCSFEINHYKTMRGAENIRFIDITSASFDPQKENVDPVKVHESLHVKDAEGRIYTGLDAFIQIWKKIKAFNKVADIASKKSIKRVLNLLYLGFATIRPHLPRKSCQQSPYCKT